MSERRFKLKPIREDSIPEALRRAERYRLLNEPAQAESICRDILRVRADDQQALVTIVLALIDQFSGSDASHGPHAAREYVDQLTDEYQKRYYSGLILERQARALLNRRMSGAFSYEVFREAMSWYERAAELSPEGNDDAILRWNSCVRTIRRSDLRPRPEDEELLLE